MTSVTRENPENSRLPRVAALKIHLANIGKKKGLRARVISTVRFDLG